MGDGHKQTWQLVTEVRAGPGGGAESIDSGTEIRGWDSLSGPTVAKRRQEVISQEEVGDEVTLKGQEGS